MWISIWNNLNWGASMKNIKIVKDNQDNVKFKVGSYYFIEYDSSVSQLPIYPVFLNIGSISPVDVRLLLEDVSSNIKFLIETPTELTEYIKKYEQNIILEDVCIFHDLRTRYLDILEFNDENIKNNVILIGFTIFEHNVYLAIKAFSLSGLAKFTEKVISYCKANSYAIELKNHVRWIQLEQSMLPSSNIIINDIFNGFLTKTLQNDYCNIFLEAFYKIDFQGYFDKSFLDKEVNIRGHRQKIRDINQFTKFFSPFWKTDISIKETSRTVLYLHDELINEDTIDKIVYTLKPHLMQYYQLHWFEDFCYHLIRDINTPSFRIVHILAGRQFNFFQSGTSSDVREIDIIVGVEHEESFKIIAIECKKTLSINEVQATNKKIKDKILKSHINIIDAYIHIGCFNNDVKFDKTINETQDKYKQGIIQLPDDSQAIDAPYYAFTISSIENLQMKIEYIINDIFNQW